MALLHQCGNGQWMGSLDSECVYYKRQRTLDCKKKTSTSPNRGERPLIRKMGWPRVPQKERERETEEGRMQCFMKKEDKSLTDLEHVKTTGQVKGVAI